MARKKQTGYFPHDTNARNSSKLIRLRMKHGAEGYGVYFMILERLRDEDGYSSPTDYDMIAFDLHVDTELVRTVVEDFGLFRKSEDGTRFYSSGFLHRMEVKDAERGQRSEAARKAIQARWHRNAEPDTERIRTEYGSDTERIRTEYGNNTERIHNEYGSDTEVIRNEYGTDTDVYAPDTKKRKEKETREKEITTTAEGAREPAAVAAADAATASAQAPTAERLRRDVAALKADRQWGEVVQMRYQLTAEALSGWLDSFVIDCLANGKAEHLGIDNVKSHFCSWLRIKQTIANDHANQQHTAARRRGTDAAAHTAADYLAGI
ncbi:DUF4373 domain-containing protein [Prevotellamassilia timonensis]|uniref:DUF4373 domain-containing protein n=1 Tax=Prevotellamassilia timonensis TaxID=1852370 RepID=UPI0008DB023B|nr:DUF4373 domain-containing protein [Prevotellamassilia timonensis]